MMVRYTHEELAAFIAANGLEYDPDTGNVCAAGTVVAIATPTRGGVLLSVFEEGYRTENTEVKAWWPTSRPSYVLFDPDTGEPEILGTLGPDEVICDRCNAEVVIRPVPLVNTYALCPACFKDTGLQFPGSIEPYVVGENSESEKEEQQ